MKYRKTTEGIQIKKHKNLIISIVVSLIVGIYIGGKMEIESRSDITEETKTTTDTTKETHKETTIVERPDGTKETKIVEDSTTNKKKSEESKTETVIVVNDNLNVSLLAAYSFRESKPIYGVSVTKELIRPITIGLFGLTDGTIGASVGINFR